MELKLSPRRSLEFLVALGIVLAVALALTFGGTSAAATVKHHHHVAHHAQLGNTPSTGGNSGAQSGAGDTTGTGTESQSPEGESPSGVDADGPGGPDAGGDHQCPPACASGEQG